MNIKINTFTLKMIAIASMLIDHMGAILFPQYIILRYIGRIAFPIYTYTLVEGFMHTRDIKKYMVRLGIFALLSEIPFDLAFRGSVIYIQKQNVFFTLFLGVLMLYLLLKSRNRIQSAALVLAILLLSEFLRTDYSSMGLLMILCFYVFRDNKVMKLLGVAAINVFLMGRVQVFAIPALIFIALHGGEQGPKCKKFFYGFYPVHLLALYLISVII
jgi:hypothetical protein